MFFFARIAQRKQKDIPKSIFPVYNTKDAIGYNGIARAFYSNEFRGAFRIRVDRWPFKVFPPVVKIAKKVPFGMCVKVFFLRYKKALFC